MAYTGEFSALLTACLWTCSALAFASATQRAGSFQVNVTRLILAAAELILLVSVMRLDVNLTGTQILYLSISGIIGLSLGDTFLFRAFREIGARVTMLIMSASPAIAALLAYFVVQETLSPGGVIGILITVAGICLVVLDRSGDGSQRTAMTLPGIVFAGLAAAGQGGGLVFAKLAFREGEINGFVATTVRIIASLVVLLPLALLSKRYASPWRMYVTDSKAFWLTALGSIAGPFLGISFSLIAIEYTKVGIAATIMAIVPILMLPFVKLVHNEPLTWRAIAGAFVAVGGVAVLFLR